MASLTLKQEKFCRKYQETGNGAESYRQVYDAENSTTETISQAVNQLLKNPKITLRLSELEEDALIEHSVTIGGLIKMYQKGYEVSEIKENGNAMKANADGIAKITGKLVDRVEANVTTSDTLPADRAASRRG